MLRYSKSAGSHVFIVDDDRNVAVTAGDGG